MHPTFPSTSDQTPWATALLSLLPFFIGGTMRITLYYLPDWSPERRSVYYLSFLLLSLLLVAGGFVLGAKNKFPRWAYPYPVYLGFTIYTLSMYAVYMYRWNFTLLNSFFLILAVIFIIMWLPGLRWYYRNIPRDWTLLSYSLYGIVLYILSTIDKDETPSLSLLVLTPSLLTLFAALAHLRIRSAFSRIVVLLVGIFAGLFFWLLPIFTGMVTVWAGLGIGLSLLLVYGVVLGGILLAPMLVSKAIHYWRVSRISGLK